MYDVIIFYSCVLFQYEKWTDEQRRHIIEDLVHGSKLKQLQYAQFLVNEKVPMKQEDFTRVLPKVLSVYLFSFLDPRSLCRCSRVSLNIFFIYNLVSYWWIINPRWLPSQDMVLIYDLMRKMFETCFLQDIAQCSPVWGKCFEITEPFERRLCSLCFYVDQKLQLLTIEGECFKVRHGKMFNIFF